MKQHVAAKEPARVAKQFVGTARSDPIPAEARMQSQRAILIIERKTRTPASSAKLRKAKVALANLS